MGVNDPRFSKIKRRARGLAGVSAPARDADDPRRYRAHAPFVSDQWLGDGLGMDDAGKAVLDPSGTSVEDIGVAADTAAAGTFIEEMIAKAPLSAWGGVTRRFYTSRATASFDTTSAAQTFMDEAIPAGLLTENKTLRARLDCAFLNGSAGADMTLQIIITLGGVTVWDETSVSFVKDNSGSDRRPMIIDFDMWRPSANLANVRCMGSVAVAGVRAPTGTGLGDMDTFPTLNVTRGSYVYPFGSVAAGVAVDMSVEQSLKVTVTMGTSDAANITSYYLRYMEIT